MLKSSFSSHLREAGCDEAGRGCLAGPVFAAAVIFPKDYRNELLDDSKKLSHKKREYLRDIIERDALSWAVAGIDNHMIDHVNILNASIMAMHHAIKKLSVQPELLLIDGNRFHSFAGIRHQCIIKGDSLYQSIAAASILAKTHRDEFMEKLHREYPSYDWARNKGYPTPAHKQAIRYFGITPYHRMSFRLLPEPELGL
jgi:ribonuclease HII